MLREIIQLICLKFLKGMSDPKAKINEVLFIKKNPKLNKSFSNKGSFFALNI